MLAARSGLLDARAENRTRKVKHEFAYTGLVHCGHCGCLLVGELKKGKYIYYHCIGNRRKCPEPYAREEILSGEFASLLRELVIPPAIFEWLGDAVLSSERTEQANLAETIRKLQARYDQIEARIGTMYMDKLDGGLRRSSSINRPPRWGARCAVAQNSRYPGGRARPRRSGHRNASPYESDERVIPSAIWCRAAPFAPGGCPKSCLEGQRIADGPVRTI